MNDISRDLFLSPESLECHPYRMNSRWWGIYTLALYLGFPCGTNRIAPEFGSDLFWLVVPLFLAFSFLFL
jgi:hypothetical protein